MTVKEWMERQGLTLESEMPETTATDTPEVMEAILEGLTEKDRRTVMQIAAESGSLADARTYAGWLKEGDVGMHSLAGSVQQGISIIYDDLKSIRYNEGLEMATPLQYIYYRIQSGLFDIIVRFTKASD